MGTLDSAWGSVPNKYRWRCLMKRHSLWIVLVWGVAFLLLCPLFLNAEVTGSISGTVIDSSGAAVANAAVILINGQTGLERRVQTNATGNYEFLALPVGDKYSVRVEVSGFRAAVQSDIKLEVNQKYRAD